MWCWAQHYYVGRFALRSPRFRYMFQFALRHVIFHRKVIVRKVTTRTRTRIASRIISQNKKHMIEITADSFLGISSGTKRVFGRPVCSCCVAFCSFCRKDGESAKWERSVVQSTLRNAESHDKDRLYVVSYVVCRLLISWILFWIVLRWRVIGDNLDTYTT